MTGSESESTQVTRTTHQERVELASALALAAANLRPLPGCWGFLTFDDRAPIFCGAGMGCFLWFQDKDSMENFLARQLPFFVDAGYEDEESDQVALELETMWKAGGFDSLALEDRILAMNTRLRNLVQVEWAGPVTELLEGSGKPEAFRAWYRKTLGCENDPSPIPLSEHEAFLESLAEYGM